MIGSTNITKQRREKQNEIRCVYYFSDDSGAFVFAKNRNVGDSQSAVAYPTSLHHLSFGFDSIFQVRYFACKNKKLLETKWGKVTKIKLLPWASRFHGHYSIAFQHEGKHVQMILLCKKGKYRRYHFDRVDRLEFYRANRVVFQSTPIRGAKISNLVEVNRVGKQRIKWDDSAEIRVIL